MVKLTAKKRKMFKNVKNKARCWIYLLRRWYCANVVDDAVLVAGKKLKTKIEERGTQQIYWRKLISLTSCQKVNNFDMLFSGLIYHPDKPRHTHNPFYFHGGCNMLLLFLFRVGCRPISWLYCLCGSSNAWILSSSLLFLIKAGGKNKGWQRRVDSYLPWTLVGRQAPLLFTELSDRPDL